MMMYQFHIALALGLIALSAGIVLFACSEKHSCSGLVKLFGLLITVVSLFSTACTIYCGVNDWNHGNFSRCHQSMSKDAPADDAAHHATTE